MFNCTFCGRKRCNQTCIEPLTVVRQLAPLIHSMYGDHVTYPQLKLPQMQADRLMQMLKLVT